MSRAPVQALILVPCLALLLSARAHTSEEPEPSPREVGFGSAATVEIVEGWPFLVSGACDALDREHLSVLEDGTAVEVVSVDRAERATNHVLLLDTSASMSDPREERYRRRGQQTKAAARAYVEWMLEDGQRPSGSDAPEPEAELMLLTFDEDLILRAPRAPVRTPADVARLHGVIKAIEGGELTLLNDAVWRLVTYLATLPERSVVILLSDGQDTGSGRAAADVLRAVDEANNVTVFTIGIGLERGPHEEFLGLVASASGGRHFAIADKQPAKLGEILAGRFGEIRDRLRNEFYVSWTPRLPAGEGSAVTDPRHRQLTVHIGSKLERCRVEPHGYRPRRFVRAELPASAPAFPSSEPGSTRLGGDLVQLSVVDAIRDGDAVRPGTDRYDHRNVRLLAPAFGAPRAFDASPGLLQPSPAEVVLGWMLAGGMPPARTEQEHYPYPLAHEINGKTFLDERLQLAGAIYEHFAPHRAWARSRITGMVREEYQRKLARLGAAGPARSAELDAQVEALVALRMESPRPQEIARVLGAWHLDLPARELAIGIERLAAMRLLDGAAGAQEESAAIQHAWPRLYDWLRPPGRVRITTPLVLSYDPSREVFGLCRIVLPRAGSWPAGSVPVQPYALQLVRWLIGLEPFADEEGDRAATATTPLAQAVRGFSLDTLDYVVEPVLPADDPPSEPGMGAPVERVRFHLTLRSPADGASVPLELVAETVFRVPAAWEGSAPLSWTWDHGPLVPERLLPRCFAAAAGQPANPIELALVASGVPACP